MKNESELAVKWFRENNMIVNPDRFQSMVLQKQDKNCQTNSLNIDNRIIETFKSMKLLGITTDNQLSFDEHISNLCDNASMQLNAINRLQRYMGPQEIKTIINSFISANFIYCPVVCHFCSCKCSHKIKQIQKRCLRIILDNYDCKTLLEKGKTSTMNAKKMRILATEIFKTFNNLNTSFKKDIFTSEVNPKVRPNNLIVKRHNTNKYGTKSYSTLGPQISNTLPENISETCYSKFRKYINT